MPPRIITILDAIRRAFGGGTRGVSRGASSLGRGAVDRRGPILGVIVACAVGVALWSHPPIATVQRGEVALRVNALTGSIQDERDGTFWYLPGLQSIRRLSLRDQVYQPGNADELSYQSVEGLSFGVDLAVRYALDPTRLAAISRDLPDDIAREVVQPEVRAVVYPVFARYTMREIFSTKRAEIQKAIEDELAPKLAADGIVLKAVQPGRVVLPADYQRGMDKLLAAELEAAKMQYTLELKEKQVQQTALEGDAERVRRDKSAEAAASEQLIAARAQEEAMKHVLPFKQKQIEQRQLEAEADKVTRIKAAEGNAQARRVEAAGEADSRQKLADAEAYRLDKVGLATTAQMAREGELLSRHPLLIQKTMADKLSDKIQVIIASPPASGGFIGSALLGAGNATDGGAQ